MVGFDVKHICTRIDEEEEKYCDMMVLKLLDELKKEMYSIGEEILATKDGCTDETYGHIRTRLIAAISGLQIMEYIIVGYHL